MHAKLEMIKCLAARYVASNQYKVPQCLTDSPSLQNGGHWHPEIHTAGILFDTDDLPMQIFFMQPGN